jgi:hypothetical protein
MLMCGGGSSKTWPQRGKTPARRRGGESGESGVVTGGAWVVGDRSGGRSSWKGGMGELRGGMPALEIIALRRGMCS